MKRCASCGVPELIGKAHRWESNGVISLVLSPQNRMIFFESETIDKVFRGIEELIGVPIEHIIIESRSRETKRYVERIHPSETKLMGRNITDLSDEERRRLLVKIRETFQNIIDIGQVYGYGFRSLGEVWESGDHHPWRVTTIKEPYSVFFSAADSLGSAEVTEGIEMWVKYEETEKDTYRIEVFPAPHPLGLKERLKRKRYQFKPGDIAYENCPECGVPREISRFIWVPERGIILNPDNDRRMAFFGPLGVDSILDDLEAELGESIPATVVEAMRKYIREAWTVEEWMKDAVTFRKMIALHGLGNLTSFQRDRRHLTLVIENSTLHLPMVGAVQALVEMAYRAESSTVEWELAEDGDLTVTVKVKR